MTLITALRGSDGIVLASDRRVVENWPSLNTGQEGTASVQITHYGSKVICGGKHDLVVGCAGDYEAQRVGREVIQALEMQSATPDDIMETLRDVAENWYKDKFGSNECKYPDYGHIIVVNPHSDRYPIWKVSLNLPSMVMSTQSKAYIGYSALSAIFFAERFYDKPEDYGVDELVFLASHVILTAGRMNSHSVHGLDVVTVRGRDVRQYSEKDLAVLQRRSLALDEKIKRSLFPLVRASGATD